MVEVRKKTLALLHAGTPRMPKSTVLAKAREREREAPQSMQQIINEHVKSTGSAWGRWGGKMPSEHTPGQRVGRTHLTWALPPPPPLHLLSLLELLPSSGCAAEFLWVFLDTENPFLEIKKKKGKKLTVFSRMAKCPQYPRFSLWQARLFTCRFRRANPLPHFPPPARILGALLRRL